MKYYRVTKGLSDKGILVPESDISKTINDFNKDWYVSVFHYDEEQKKKVEKSGTVSGVTGLKSNKLVFDFDNKDNIEAARKDALDLTSKLLSYGIIQDEFNICMSGNKGFSVELTLANEYDSTVIKNIAKNLAGEFLTWDSVIYNESRIFRAPYTKHNVTGLYKIPISLTTLSDNTVDQIKMLAVNVENAVDWKTKEITLPIVLLKAPTEKVEKHEVFDTPSDMPLNIKWLSPCRQAILNGFFKSGHRSNSLMALCAALKAQNLPKEIAHRMLVGASELQAERTKSEPFPESEIDRNIISVVYGPQWQGKTYGCKDHEFLKDICPTRNTTMCSINKQTAVVSIDAVAGKFSSYAADIDKNTIKTGIKSIDDNIRLQTCSHVVIAACSGTGKTSMVLNILNNVSNQGNGALFASLDMGSNLIYEKLAKRVSGFDDKKLYDLYRSKKKKEIAEIEAAISKEFKNTSFDFRSGITVEELRENILNAKQKQGDNLKLVVVDFINRIRGPYSEETANLNYVAPRISDLANETETLIISLAQTARHKGGPSTPLLDSRVSKGSSAIEESATVVLSLWRPGYMLGDDDKYMSIGVVKTRMGREFVSHLRFDGLTSHIRDLNSDEYIQYENLMERIENEKKDEKAKSRSGGDSPW